MYRIEHFAHTADIRVRIEGDSLPELFLAGLFAMNEILQPDACAQTLPNPPVQHQIWLHSPDPTALLIDFLSEALTACLSEKCIFCEWIVSTIDDTSLHATLLGRPVAGFDDDIKAVTYHEAEVIRNASGNWETFVVFDI